MKKLLSQYALAAILAVLSGVGKVIATSLHAHQSVDWDEVAATALDDFTPVLTMLAFALHLPDLGSSFRNKLADVAPRLRLRQVDARHPPDMPPHG